MASARGATGPLRRPLASFPVAAAAAAAAFLMAALSSPAVPHAAAAAGAVKTIWVDGGGGGDFATVQEAVDAVPDGNREWVRIHVAAGVYWEQVTIGEGKEFVVLEGDGEARTLVEWGAHASPATGDPGSATLAVLAPNFVAKGITFKNTYRREHQHQPPPPPSPALAAIIWGDKSAFYNCSFIGYQDTLCDMSGRHYFRRCYIEGFVDFIFGLGQSVYEGCTLVSNGGRPHSSPGWITAQGRSSEADTGGFVFRSCIVKGTGRTYLGRAWGQFSRVIFFHTYMSGIVVPEGWQLWGKDRFDVTYAEIGCSGPGSAASGRVLWEKKEGDLRLHQYETGVFINQEGWLQQQP